MGEGTRFGVVLMSVTDGLMGRNDGSDGDGNDDLICLIDGNWVRYYCVLRLCDCAYVFVDASGNTTGAPPPLPPLPPSRFRVISTWHGTHPRRRSAKGPRGSSKTGLRSFRHVQARASLCLSKQVGAASLRSRHEPVRGRRRECSPCAPCSPAEKLIPVRVRLVVAENISRETGFVSGLVQAGRATVHIMSCHVMGARSRDHSQTDCIELTTRFTEHLGRGEN
jgi:hypothetical protein